MITIVTRPVLKVMTRNLFLGADLTPAYEALSGPGAADLPAVVAATFNPGPPLGAVQRTDFPARASAVAQEIEATAPDLIALQEAAVWRTRGPSGSTTSDHLELLEVELARRDLGYRRVATVENGDVELPSAAGIAVGLTNRDAILARGGLRLSNVQTGAFSTTLPIRTAQGTFGLGRGWAAVDAGIGDRTLRFVATHLEVGSPAAAAQVQLAQVDELLDGPARTSLPVVLAGDFNARPGRPAYARLREAGYDDAWTRTNPDDVPGFTCCRGASLDNPADVLKRRIDLIFTRGDIVATECVAVGDQPDDFRAGLWPSDHAGVVARLELTASC